MRMDKFDQKILTLLQQDGRLSSIDLAEKVGLSASQCTRRRMALEDKGLITGYHAALNREALGFGLVNLVSVTLSNHDRENAKHFASMVKRLPQITEAYALTGDMDYQLKIITRDLKDLSTFVNEHLLPNPAVQTVKTSIVLETLKETNGVPV